MRNVLLRTKSSFTTALLVAGVLGLAGCGKRQETSAAPDSAKPARPAASAEASKPRQVLNLGNGSEPSDLDPQTVTGRPESDVVRALMEGLVNFDPTNLQPVPGVAERWETSEDKRTYTFHLRADAKWSNGDPVTAQDFVQSWQRLLSPSFHSEYVYVLFCVAGAEDYHRGRLTDFSQVGFRAPDPRTVVITLDHPSVFFLNLLQHYTWMPVHRPTLEKFGGWTKPHTNWTRAGNFVGNGPFVLKDWRANQMIVVHRSPTYWNRANVKLDEIRFHSTDSIDTEERMFRTGQLHITKTVPLSAVDGYRAQPNTPLRIDPIFGTMYLRVNVGRPGLSDPRVRRALAIGIDRVALTTRVNRTGKIPAYNFTPPGSAFTPKARLEGTIEDARALLAEAGYPGGRGFPKVELLFNTSENGRIICEAMQERWRAQLGLEVVLLNQEWKVYLNTMIQRQYDLAIGIWTGDYLDATTFLDTMVTGGGNNRTGWGNPEYDSLLKESMAARELDAKLAIFERMEAILMRELPVLPVYFHSAPHLIRANVRGYHPTLLDIHPWQHVWLED